MTVGQARLAILGGSVLVALVVLAEFGAFEILGFRTLTTEIYTEFTVGFNQPAALRLLPHPGRAGRRDPLRRERRPGQGRGRPARCGGGPAVAAPCRSAGRVSRCWAGSALLVGLALGVPVGAVIYLIVRGRHLHPAPGLAPRRRRAHLLATPPAPGVVATAGRPADRPALGRFPGAEVRLLERSNMLILAVPGLVIALSFTYVTEHLLAGFLYQTPPLLVLTYAVMFFPMAVVSVRAAVARSPVGLEEVGHSLGVRRLAGLLAGHPAPDRPRAGRRLLPRLPRVGHRAHGHAGAHPDRRADPGHPVLGLPDRSRLQPGGALRRHHHAHRRRAELRAGPLVRPPACPRPSRSVRGGRTGTGHNGDP